MGISTGHRVTRLPLTMQQTCPDVSFLSPLPHNTPVLGKETEIPAIIWLTQYPGDEL